MKFIRVCLLILLCPVAAPAEDAKPSPLAFLEPLIGGHWLTDAKLPGGEPIRTRVTYRYGFAKQFVRGRVHVITDKGDYLSERDFGVSYFASLDGEPKKLEQLRVTIKPDDVAAVICSAFESPREADISDLEVPPPST